MSQPSHDYKGPAEVVQLMRRVIVEQVKLPADLRRLIVDRNGNCQCVDCVGMRVKFGYGDGPQAYTLPEATAMVVTLVHVAEAKAEQFELQDSALSHAGLICWQVGEAFHARSVDYPAQVKHTLSQNHAHLRDVIEAKRLLLWFHRECDSLCQTRIRVGSFDFPIQDSHVGLVFNEDLRVRICFTAAEFIRRLRDRGDLPSC